MFGHRCSKQSKTSKHSFIPPRSEDNTHSFRTPLRMACKRVKPHLSPARPAAPQHPGIHWCQRGRSQSSDWCHLGTRQSSSGVSSGPSLSRRTGSRTQLTPRLPCQRIDGSRERNTEFAHLRPHRSCAHAPQSHQQWHKKSPVPELAMRPPTSTQQAQKLPDKGFDPPFHLNFCLRAVFQISLQKSA